MDDKITIELCMGSSCYARGNISTLETLENYIEEHGLNDRVELCGHLCMGKCTDGPNVTINGKEYTIDSPDTVIDILKTII